MDNRNGTIYGFQGSENGKNNRVIASQTNDTWMRPSARRCCIRGVVEDLAITLFHLLESMSGIKRRDGDVAAVNNAEPLFEGIHAPDRIVAASLLFARRACANATRAEACAGTVGGASIIGETEDGDIKGLLWRCQSYRSPRAVEGVKGHEHVCGQELDIVAIQDGQKSLAVKTGDLCPGLSFSAFCSR